MNRLFRRAAAPATLAPLALLALSVPAAQAAPVPSPGHPHSQPAHQAAHHATHHPAHPAAHSAAHGTPAARHGRGAKSASGRGSHHPTAGKAGAQHGQASTHPAPQSSHSAHPAHPAHPAPQHGTPPAGPAQGAGLTPAGDPAGNNGTVKIKGLGDLDTTPNNVAHPGCAFQVMWYGYDEGADVVSTVSFAMQAPTADVGLTVDGPTSVFVGGDPATGAGTPTGLDGTATYQLSFVGAPQAQQGYHVRLTVSTPYAQGNDTKTKVFWVSPCTSPILSGGTTSGPTGGTMSAPAEETTGGQVSAPLATAGAATSTTATAHSTTNSILASERTPTGASSRAVAASAAVVPTAVDAGTAGTWTRALHTWHGTALPLLLMALGLGTTGVAMRRRHHAVARD